MEKSTKNFFIINFLIGISNFYELFKLTIVGLNL
jgi:hypothetical protein